MDAGFRTVTTSKEIEALSEIASEIWFEYWPDLIGEDQTRYMVESFQSNEALSRDIKQNGYEYWFITAELIDDEGTNTGKTYVVGYTGGHMEQETNRFFISKIYLFADERGKGYASQVVKFYEDLCRERGLDAMYLTVNKHNDLAIRAYRAKGFETIDAVETDIGEGFIMDDYIMEKRLPA